MSEVKPPARREARRLAPAGDEAFAPLYDLQLRWPVRRAWLQFVVREGAQVVVGRPLERLLMGAWLKRLPGRRPIERLGLPRRALEQTLGFVRKVSALAHAVLKNSSKCSFTHCKLRFFAVFCLA